jgi:hypothetical protein
MMIAVVVDAFRPGVTGWAAVRSTVSLKVRGLKKGLIKIFFNIEEERAWWHITEDCEMDLPKAATRVKVEVVALEDSRLFVDLE